MSETAPLSGVVVVDLTRYVAGSYCTMLMADAGATVIKVEPPTGEDTRHLEPFLESEDSAYFLRMNRNKYSVDLDLKCTAGLDALERLIAHADVLVENFRPGVLERLGLGAERLAELSPGLVYCSISGFGHSPSPLRERPAYNIVAEYEAGVYVQRAAGGGTPGPLGPPVGDMFPSLHALSGLLMALYRRTRTGRGGRVDISMYDSMLSLNELRSSYAVLHGKEWDPYAHPFYSPYGVFAVCDGYICIDVTTDRQWRGVCAAIGRAEICELEGLATGPERVASYDAVIREPLERWLAGQVRDEAVKTLVEHDVPAATIRNPGEALESRQAAARDMHVTVHGSGAGIATAGNPIKIDRPRDGAETSVPRLGADTEWVLREVARLSTDEVSELTGKVRA